MSRLIDALEGDFSTNRNAIIGLDEGWREVKTVFILPLAWYVTATASDQLVASECSPPSLYVTTYDLIHRMATQRTPYNWSGQLYDRYTGTVFAFVNALVENALLEHNLSSAFRSFSFFAVTLSRPFKYLERYYAKHNNLPTFYNGAVREFRRALDKVCGSSEAATAAVHACTDLADADKELLADCTSSSTVYSAEVVDSTQMTLMIGSKLASHCLMQLRKNILDMLHSAASDEHKNCLKQQLHAVTGVAAGSLTLVDLREAYFTWDEQYVDELLWSAFYPQHRIAT
jgi:hypothetical protein